MEKKEEIKVGEVIKSVVEIYNRKYLITSGVISLIFIMALVVFYIIGSN